MKILIADKFEQWGVEQLKAGGDEVSVEAGLKGPELTRRMAEYDPDVLIVRSTKVTGADIEAGKRLLLVIRAGSGYDTIDVATASQRGVMVANCPGQNSVAVAELTIGLMVALDRRIPDNVIDLRNHKWNKKLYSKAGLGLKGKTIGIIGAGKIGTEVARRAIAFDMNVMFYHLGRHRRLADFPQCHRSELDDLMRQSDVVSIHVPGGESTRNLIDARRIGLMKPTALLINTARADVIDEEALAVALREGRIRGAALDVFRNEPPADGTEFTSPIADVPNLYGTHHIGASTEEAQLAVAAETARIVREFKATGRAPNCVNMAAPGNAAMLVVRLVNRPGGLAQVFRHVADEGINVEEMDHVIYDGGKAAVAHIRVSKTPTTTTIERLRSDREHILGVDVMTVE